MAGGPVLGDGLLVSNAKVKMTLLKVTGWIACCLPSLARVPQRLPQHRRHGPRLRFHFPRKPWKAGVAIIRRATWCEFRREESRARRECGGRGLRSF